MLTKLLTTDPALDLRVSTILDLASVVRIDVQFETAERLLAALEPDG